MKKEYKAVYDDDDIVVYENDFWAFKMDIYFKTIDPERFITDIDHRTKQLKIILAPIIPK